jgi:hypothetical protein
MDLHTAARRMACCRWVEEQLFEVMGAWLRDVDEPEVKRYLAVQSERHGWHAQLWLDRQPAVEDFVLPAPSDAAARIAAALREAAGTGATIDKLTVVTRVLLGPLVAEYRAYLAAIDERLDGPTARVLTLVLRDETEALVEGERLLESLLTTPESVARAAALQTRLEALLVSEGGLFGPP